MQKIIKKIEEKQITVTKTQSIDRIMGYVFCYAEKTTKDEFLQQLANSLKKVEEKGGIIPSDIKIVTDGEGRFAATMKMGR